MRRTGEGREGGRREGRKRAIGREGGKKERRDRGRSERGEYEPYSLQNGLLEV